MKTQTNISHNDNSRFLPIIQSKLDRNLRESIEIHQNKVKAQLFNLPLNKIPEQLEQKREFTADSQQLMDRLNSPFND